MKRAVTIFSFLGSSEGKAGVEPAHTEGTQPGLHLNSALHLWRRDLPDSLGTLGSREHLLQLSADWLVSHMYIGLVLLGITLLMLCSLI